MATQQPRFSRRFLTILIIVTSIAIALLSRMGEHSGGDANPASPDAPPAALLEHNAAPDRPAVPHSEPGP